MLLVKEGFPEEDELVLCTVTNIHFHSVFVKLDEYGKTGLIHISEIAPGRIRNIRDYVIEDKKVVCKVLKVDKKTGHIDLSLRRVNESQKRKKLNQIKLEQKAEKIVEQVAKSNALNVNQLYGEIVKKILPKYSNISACFMEVVKNGSLLDSLGIDKKVSEQLTEIIKLRFKEEEIVIEGVLKLQSYQPNGLEIVKAALIDALGFDKNVNIYYKGGGAYNVQVKSNNYKEAEKILDKTVKKAIAFTEKGLGTGEFIRKEKQ